MVFFPRARLSEELEPFLLAADPPPAPARDAAADESADAAVAAAEPQGPVPDHNLPLVHVMGRVCSLRILGRAMIFFDLVHPDVQS